MYTRFEAGRVRTRSLCTGPLSAQVFQPQLRVTSGLAVTRPEQGFRAVVPANRIAVVDQPLAVVGEEGRTAGKACAVLLAVVGREPSDAAPVRKNAAADSGFAATCRVGAAARRNQPGRRRGVEGGVSEKSLRNGAHLGFIVTAKALLGPLRSFALERMRKRSPAEATGGILVRSREAKWRFRLNRLRR